MNLILTASRNINKYPEFREVLVRELSRFQYNEELGSDEILFHIPQSPSGGDHWIEKFCKEFKLHFVLYNADWRNTKEFPQKLVTDHYGEYNSWAGFNRNTRVVESVRTDDGGALIAFETNKSDTKDIVRKAGTTKNINVIQIDCKGMV